MTRQTSSSPLCLNSSSPSSSENLMTLGYWSPFYPSVLMPWFPPHHHRSPPALHCYPLWHLMLVSKPIYTNIQWYHPQSHVRHHFSKSIPWFLFFRLRSKYPEFLPAFFMLCELFFTSPVLIYLLVWTMPSGKFKGFEILTWLAYIIRE